LEYLKKFRDILILEETRDKCLVTIPIECNFKIIVIVLSKVRALA